MKKAICLFHCSVCSWAFLEELHEDVKAFGLKSTNANDISNLNLSLDWLESTFPELADQSLEKGNKVVLRAHPYAPLDASLTLQACLQMILLSVVCFGSTIIFYQCLLFLVTLIKCTGGCWWDRSNVLFGSSCKLNFLYSINHVALASLYHEARWNDECSFCAILDMKPNNQEVSGPLGIILLFHLLLYY